MERIEKVSNKEVRQLIARCESRGLYKVMSCLLELMQLRAEQAQHSPDCIQYGGPGCEHVLIMAEPEQGRGPTDA